MTYYSDELIEEVRSRNDVVDVISGYVRLQKREARILGSVLSTMKRHRPFLSHRANRCITVLAAAQAGTYSPL